MSKVWLASPTMHEDAEMKYIKEAFDQNWVAPLGENVDRFEEEVSKYVDTVSGVALSSGTAAIHMALKYVGVGPGDIVLCSTLTFAASCNPIIYEGATPVFVDSEYDTWNMDPSLLRSAIRKYPNTKAVIVVNLYGTPAKLDEIVDICKEHNISLIEDAAESLGATWKGKQTGSFGKFGVFSFNGNKIITTSGGGMVVSNDCEALTKIRFWATQSREPKRYYEHKEIGYNYRLSNVLAGIGRGQMEYLHEHIHSKKKIYETYKNAFVDIREIEMNPVPLEAEPNYWLSCILLSPESKVTAKNIIDALEQHDIQARPIWKPMHLQQVFSEYKVVTRIGICNNIDRFESVSEDIFKRGVCLPSDIKNSEETMSHIISIIRQLFNK